MKRHHPRTWSDGEIQHLLSNGYLSGQQYDEIEARVLQRVARAEGGRLREVHSLGRWARVAGAPLAACSIVGLIWFLQTRESANPASVRGQTIEAGTAGVHTAPSRRAVVPKGDAAGDVHAPPSGILDVGCSNDDPHVCHFGDTLYVSVNSAIVAGYVGAYAEPLDSHTKERIWYLPLDDRAVNVPGGAGTVVLPYGVRISPVHARGRYRVTLWLSREPIQRRDPVASRGKDVLALDAVIVEVRP